MNRIENIEAAAFRFGKQKKPPQVVRIPKPPSLGEETFALHMKAYGLNPVREFQIAPDRKYRADFCFQDEKLLIEIDGGVHSAGRHTRGSGYEEDCRKMNLAQLLGFTVLRYSTEMVTAGAAANEVKAEIAKRRGSPCV